MDLTQPEVCKLDLTLVTVARGAAVAACLYQAAEGLVVLARESRTSRPKPIERDARPLMLVNLAGGALFIIVGLAIAVTNGATLSSAPEPLNAGLRVAGIVTLAVAVLLAAWGSLTMGKNLVTGAEVGPQTELVTGGPFGIVRHPLLLSLLLLWLGAALALLAWPMAVGFVVLIPAFVARARAEETLLAHRFGDEYRSYAARVPMLLPGRPRQ